MRYCLFAFLVASSLLADEQYEGGRGAQAADVIGGLQHSAGGTDPVAGIKIRGGISRFLAGYGELSYSRTPGNVFVRGGNNGQVRSSLIDLNAGLEAHGSGMR